ncbi:FAD-dependent oxidoreductase [Streptomyces sp. NPDC090127]|uniref:FAD-dependent oxidoreductase n=1 Tax=Streptomyces sp. NPDC090127 TaxID=3365953 RepID=UPI003815A940
MTDHVGDHAVVLGAGMSGLLTARVLADAFARVTVVDRDELRDMREPRRGVPQGRQVHGLQPRGGEILEELFPGFTDETVALGAQLQDTVNDAHWHFDGRRLSKAPSTMATVAAGRPFLEWYVRGRVETLPNVTFLERHDVVGLDTTPDRGRVVGVRVQPHGEETATEPTVLAADLVVDATGRGSRTPVWLEELGYPAVPEDRARIGLGYATRHYRMRPGSSHDGRTLVVVASAEQPRGAVCTRIEGDRFVLTAYGILGDHPPTDPAGFDSFLTSLAVPDVAAFARSAEPLDAPVAYRFPVSLRRRYEHLERFPAGLLVAGDGVCSFNPTYAQGMTVAALGALTLRRHLRRGTAPRARAYFRDLARDAVDPSWEAMNLNDLAFPGVEGERTLRIRVAHAYVALVQKAAARDATVADAFIRVVSLMSGPGSLMRPRILLRVLRHAGGGAGPATG